MGPPGSENWHAMLDAAEDILREEGHAQLTSRRIAERIGVKQRLVYYYFHTMEELIVEMFRRSSERDLQRLREVGASAKPLRQLWEICFHSHDARLISEYMALANHIPELRAEVIKFIEESREVQIAAISAALERHPAISPIKAPGLALLATSIGLSLNREEQLGIRLGHPEIFEVVAEILDKLED
jgi:AcrR family transcriptional regulator